MKKKMFFVAAAVAVLSLSSCKKDYTCDCDITVLGMTQSSSTDILDSSKDDAETACDDLETEANTALSEASCTLNEK
jgi:hypothetical protein